jgi:hypothetical protein
MLASVVLARRLKSRRGNPADASENPRIAPASRVTHQTGLPRHFVARNDREWSRGAYAWWRVVLVGVGLDWIAASLALLAMTNPF